MLDVLQDIRHTVRPVQVHIALLFADKGLVPHRMELLPEADEVLDHANVGARFDIEITRIEITADIQTRNEFQCLVLGIRARTLAVLVEMVGVRRSLEITLLERLAVPEPIAFINRHVVHVHRNPDIAGRDRNPVIHRRIDDEILCLHLPIAQEIDALLPDLGEVELGIIIFEIRAPFLHRTGEHLMHGGIGLHLPDGSRGLDLVLLVQFDDRHLRLVGHIAHLGEAHVRFADPAGNGIRLHGPGHDLPGLPGRQHAPDNHPTVLGQHPAVQQIQGDFVRRNLDHPLRRIRRQEQFVAALHRNRLNEHPRPPIVIGPVTAELEHFFLIRADLGIAHGIARNAVRPAIHQIGLAPILGRQEFQHEPRFADQHIRHRLVQVHGNLHGLALGLHDHPGIEIVIIVTEPYLDALGKRIDGTGCHLGDEVPLLRRGTQADGAALESPDAMVDHFDTGVLLIVEAAGKRIVEHQDIDPLALEILQLVQLEIPRWGRARDRSKEHGHRQADSSHHTGYCL